jgi:hypothetical protein
MKMALSRAVAGVTMAVAVTMVTTAVMVMMMVLLLLPFAVSDGLRHTHFEAAVFIRVIARFITGQELSNAYF